MKTPSFLRAAAAVLLPAALAFACAWPASGEEPASTVAGAATAQEETRNPYANDPAAFPTLATPVDEHGAPVTQTLRFNQPAWIESGARISGFRFRVDRTQAAEKQGVADKTKMDLFWFFVMPPEVKSWYIEPVKGEMQGFSNFYPLKESAFKNSPGLLPAKKSYVLIQRLAADRFKEGEEYIMWFRCAEEAVDPIEVSLALGYRQDRRSYRKWEDLTDVARFLGLEPAGARVNYRSRAF